MTSSQPNYLNLALVCGAFIASLFFNGLDIRFFALVFVLLLGWLLSSGIKNYRKGYIVGNLLILGSVFLFWFWLGISIVFSQVTHLSMVNFWWVGIFPLLFLAYSISPDRDALWEPLFALIVLVVLTLCAYALYQVFALHELPNATFFNKNSLAALINLLFFPVLAYTLIKSSRLIVAGSVIFIFALLLALINSRGALLAFFPAGIVLIVLGWHQIDKRRLLMVCLLITVAFVIANLALNYVPQNMGMGVVKELATLQNVETAGLTRFVIWQPAWELFKQYPLTGIGLGCYFLAIPPFLHNDDHSAGFYVHNDYLQIALETGLPGFIFLFLILLAVIYRLIKTLRATSNDHPQYLHLIALFAALLTLAIHSAFTFNLYVMPIMLLAGLLLGRFNQLTDQLVGKQSHTWRVARLVRPGIYKTVLVISIITLASYFLGLAASYHYQHKAYQLARTNQLEKAHQAFRVAQKLAPRLDSVYYADADLLRKSAVVLSDRPELAYRLLEEAKALLDRAEELNPLRPQTAYIRGLVLQQAVLQAPQEIIQAYETALRRNPRFIPARLALVHYLQEHGHDELAFQRLKDGLAYRYRQLSPAYLQLLEMTSILARQRGEDELAYSLTNLLAQYRLDYATMPSTERHHEINNPY